MKKYDLFFLFALLLLISLLEPGIKKQAGRNEERQQKEKQEYFAILRAGDVAWEKRIKETSYWEQYKRLREDIQCFPVPKEDEESITYSNSWQEARAYKGSRSHEGCDLMDVNNRPGGIPILCMTEGKIEKMGWLELGGYRIGIRAPSGIYYYYAHLDSYHPLIKVGCSVRPGQLLGYMGNSGYGQEGTKGQFPVHLHLGIYIMEKNKEFSVNPYYLLKIMQSDDKKD